MTTNFDIGIMYVRSNLPEELVPFLKQAEQANFDEVWLVEDCFYASGLASAGAALASTEHVRVGIGIMPAVMRNPALTAMEIATLARMYPGRFLPGFGHGVAEWMKQIGAFPRSQLTALKEVTAAVQALLQGDLVSFQGQHVQLDQVQLEYPPAIPPIISLGVRGPKSLQLSGSVAGGTILAEYASAPYVRWAKEQIQIGQQQAGRASESHRMTVYTLFAMDDDHDAALQTLRPLVARNIASGRRAVYLQKLGIVEEAEQILADGGEAALVRDMPDEWITQLAVAGTPTECRDAIQNLADVGADSVVLVPVKQDTQTISIIQQSLLSLLK